jgi:hypothetical protein
MVQSVATADRISMHKALVVDKPYNHTYSLYNCGVKLSGSHITSEGFSSTALLRPSTHTHTGWYYNSSIRVHAL